MRLFVLAPFALAACLPTDAPKPLVSDYNGHVVKVQYHPYALGTEYKASPVYAVARETCGSDASYQGVRRVSDYAGEHTFLCQK